MIRARKLAAVERDVPESGTRPPYIVRRSFKWTYLYAAVEPTTRGVRLLHVSAARMDDGCLQMFLARTL